VTSLLVEGGGEVNAAFLLGGFAHRAVFFYAPMVLGGSDAFRGVAGEGARSLAEALSMVAPEWRRFGPDMFMTARVASPSAIAP
jgi:diaminohydroxyphosphoribosylaminopyrimidine deaminase/5-amino-6-(5-phosphoribosylamino)uracil reductase